MMPELSSLTLSASPVAYYKLESDGTDSSGTGNGMTVSGSPTFSAARYGNGVTIDETTKTLEKTSASSLPTGTANLSISLWINRLNTLASSSGGSMALGVRTDGNSLSSICPGSAQNNVRLSMFSGGVASYGSDIPIPANIWTHVAVVRSNSGQTIKSYLNGLLLTTDTVTARDHGSASVVRMGDGFDWNCQFDDGAIFAAALTALDVKRIYGAKQPMYFG